MGSTTHTGDRRWGPARKSGMTVLGKVPKPINLPSQRSENHGLDPNVEIVPKGTFTWGNRTSSSIPNVWSSSTSLFPQTGGGSGSPIHLDERPSSGSGTRPSTSSSDKSHEPACNAWGTNLRPSSASGSFASVQSVAGHRPRSADTHRPRSAETRPSSAQTSRFAETSLESTVAWGPSRTAQREGSASVRINKFTSSFVDFPTLSSDKKIESPIQQGYSSHGRPGSASGTAAMHRDAKMFTLAGAVTEVSRSDCANVHMKADGYPDVGSAPPNINCQDPHSQQLHNGAVGAPYRPAVSPGSYPMEPYRQYPQFLDGPHSSSESVLKSGAGPAGYHPLHHLGPPDSYMVSNHPGVYPTSVPKVLVKFKPGQEALSQRATEWEDHSTGSVVPKLAVNSSKETSDSLTRKAESDSFPAIKKNISLIEKIEALNNKARGADSRSTIDEKAKHFKAANKTDISTKVISLNPVSNGDAHVSASDVLDPSIGETQISLRDENISPRPSELHHLAVGQAGFSEARDKTQYEVHKRALGVRGKIDDQTKLQSSGTDILVIPNISNKGSDPGLQEFHSHVSKDDGHLLQHPVTGTTDLMDHNAQRAKLKEIAKRRAKELQEEEEKRTREQKAKALAKLEELNRRALAHSLHQKESILPLSNSNQHQQEEEEPARKQKEVLTKLEELSTVISQKNVEQNVLLSIDVGLNQDCGAGATVKTSDIIMEAPGPITVNSSSLSTRPNDKVSENPSESIDFSMCKASDVLISSTQDSAIPLSLVPTNNTEVAAHLISSDRTEIVVSKQKQTDSRSRPNISKDENRGEMATNVESIATKTNASEVSVASLSGDSIPRENAVRQKKKSNWKAKNKNKKKIDEALSPTKGSLEKDPTEKCNDQSKSASKTQDPEQRFSATVENQGPSVPSDHGQSQATEKVHAMVGNQGKPQSSRKSVKYEQARHANKFHGSGSLIWAPVRPSNTNELTGEGSTENTSEANSVTYGRNERDMQNGRRTKRAEMARYVPKPVAKALARHENSQERSSSNQAACGNVNSVPDFGPESPKGIRVDGSALGKSELLATKTKSGEVNKATKHGKVRDISGSPSSLRSSSVGVISDPTKLVGEPSDKDQTLTYHPITFGSLHEVQFPNDDWRRKNSNLVPTEKVTIPADIKDQLVPSRQRRQQSHVHEGSNYSNVIEDSQGGPDAKACDGTNVSRIKGQSSHLRPQWQPKTRAYSENYHHGNRGDGGYHHGNRGDGGQRVSSQEVTLATDVERPRVSTRAQHEHPVSLAPRWQGHKNGPFSRGQETTYRVRDRGYNDDKLINYMDGERQRNTHFEDQPVRSRSRDSFQQNHMITEEAQEGPRAPQSGFREQRGRYYPSRGGRSFYGQREVDDSYNRRY